MRLIPLSSNTELVQDEHADALIEYTAPTGILFKDRIILFEHSRNNSIEIDRIKRIAIIKKKTILQNLILFVLAVAVGSTLFFYKFTMLEFFYTSLITLSMLSLSFILNDSRYKIIVNLANYSFIELVVHKREKKEAKKFVGLVKNKLKKKDADRS